MERRIRPVFRCCDEAMLHRVPVNVIDMAVEVVGVTDKMFPEAPLPDSALALSAASARVVRTGKRFRKTRFYEPPAHGIIMIVRRQAPDAMEVFRQDADGNGFERMAFRNLAIGRAQGVDVVGQKLRAPVDQIDREKEKAAGNEQTSVIWHAKIIINTDKIR